MSDERGDNGAPANLTLKARFAFLRALLKRTDISAQTKCVGFHLALEAGRDGVVEASTAELLTAASAKDRETVFRATKQLASVDVGAIDKLSGKGQPGKYRVIPPAVVDSIVAAYDQLKSSRVQPDQSAAEESGETGRVAPEEAVGSKPTSRVKAVGFNPTSPIKPDQSDVAPSCARIESPSEILTPLEVKEESEGSSSPFGPPISAPTWLDGQEGLLLGKGGKLTLLNGVQAQFAADFPKVDLEEILDRVGPRVLTMASPTVDGALAMIRRECRLSANRRGKGATKLPKDWVLTKALGDWALEHFVITPDEVRTEAAGFRDFWTGKSGRNGFKNDWTATWKNWVRNSRRNYRVRKPEVDAAPDLPLMPNAAKVPASSGVFKPKLSRY